MPVCRIQLMQGEQRDNGGGDREDDGINNSGENTRKHSINTPSDIASTHPFTPPPPFIIPSYPSYSPLTVPFHPPPPFLPLTIQVRTVLLAVETVASHRPVDPR